MDSDLITVLSSHGDFTYHHENIRILEETGGHQVIIKFDVIAIGYYVEIVAKASDGQQYLLPLSYCM